MQNILQVLGYLSSVLNGVLKREKKTQQTIGEALGFLI